MASSIRVYLLTAFIIFSALCTPLAAQLTGDNSWLAKIRPQHPRMFLNSDTIKQVRQYTLTHEKDYYLKIRRTVESIPLIPNPESCEGGTNNLYGNYAQQAAFVWLMEGDSDALAKAKSYLQAGVEFYNRCSSQRKTVNWFSAGRVCALTAYDWIYNELDHQQRKTIAEGFVKHYNDCLSGKRFVRQNRSAPNKGFYGPTNLAWYVGLACYGDGLVDAEAEKLLKQGFKEHSQLVEFRKKAAGDDGGTATIALSYGLGMYPWSEFNFMHTYQSATGLKVQDSYDHISRLPEWIIWNYLPGRSHFGLGDGSPAGGFGDSFLEMHMLNIAHFYAERFPLRAAKAMYVRDKLLSSREHDSYWWPIAPLLVTNCEKLGQPVSPDESWPLAKNFRSAGIVHMRSSWEDDATCAMFVSGGQLPSHRHYDQGHFAIYSGEHLTGNSGYYGPRLRNEHLSEYFYRSVAANCLLIRSDEKFDRPPKVWGGRAETLDGGQCEHFGKQIGFSTNKYYSYASLDMTNCYDKRKCDLATRQFVFVYPDTFIVFDRVRTARRQQKDAPPVTPSGNCQKSWLLHSVEKPVIETQPLQTLITIPGQQKQLRCISLLPEKQKVELIGGDGKEFFSAGKNRPQKGEAPKLAGKWRVEISPAENRDYDVFLNFLQAADKDAAPTQAQLITDGQQQGVSFTTISGNKVQLLFNRRSIVSGNIIITDPAGNLLLEERLAESLPR